MLTSNSNPSFQSIPTFEPLPSFVISLTSPNSPPIQVMHLPIHDKSLAGCPTYGNFGGNMGSANDNCCHCIETGSPTDDPTSHHGSGHASYIIFIYSNQFSNAWDRGSHIRIPHNGGSQNEAPTTKPTTMQPALKPTVKPTSAKPTTLPTKKPTSK